MKKFVLTSILALAGLVGSAGLTGCDVDADFQGVYNVYNIKVQPGEWKTPSDGASYLYVEKSMPELNATVMGNASYTTYYVFEDGVTVETPLPYTEYRKENNGTLWEFTLSAEYSRGTLRIKMSTSDLKGYVPDYTMNFRLAIGR